MEHESTRNKCLNSILKPLNAVKTSWNQYATVSQVSTYSECLLSLLALAAWLEKYQEVQVLRHGLGVLSDVGVANRDWLQREQTNVKKYNSDLLMIFMQSS